MNSFERVFNRLEGKPVDRLPNICLVMMFAARQIGAAYGKYVTDYKTLSDGVLRCYEEFGIDSLCVISDPMREAAGFGADVVIPEDDVPYALQPLISDVSEIGKLKITDPSSAERMNDRLLAVRHLSERAGGDVPVVGWVEGAVAESCDLMDMTDFMMNLMDFPDEMHEMLRICNEQSILFARAQIQAGAKIIGLGDAASSLIGPALYEEFALPYQKQLIDAVHEAGAKVRLHICGNLGPVLEFVAETGADIVDLDHMVSIQDAARIFPETMCIAGNFDPVSVLLQGTPEGVREAVQECADQAGANRCFVSAGCEVPKFTPPENLLAIRDFLAGR